MDDIDDIDDIDSADEDGPIGTAILGDTDVDIDINPAADLGPDPHSGPGPQSGADSGSGPEPARLASDDPRMCVCGGIQPAARRGVVDLQIGLTTLMCLDDNPGLIAGWGP